MTFSDLADMVYEMGRRSAGAAPELPDELAARRSRRTPLPQPTPKPNEPWHDEISSQEGQ